MNICAGTLQFRQLPTFNSFHRYFLWKITSVEGFPWRVRLDGYQGSARRRTNQTPLTVRDANVPSENDISLNA